MEALMIWKQRWEALESMMEVLQHRFAQEDVKNVRHLDILNTLLDGLRDFSKHQFAFFFDGFGKNNFIKLANFPNNEYPADYALRITVNQIAHDVDLIQRIGEQRIIATKNQQRPLLGTLYTADRLAETALNPVLSQQANQAPVVLTYFQKSMNVRIIPYAPIVLIGIPTTCVEAKRDFLAIPHEVGHYLYWCHTMVENGPALHLPKSPYSNQIVKEFLDLKFATDPEFKNNELLHEWQEEIFADIYGCIVGGPVMALSGQFMQNEQPAEWFIQKDRSYPFAIVRPYIYIQVLEQSGVSETSRKLREHWEYVLKTRYVEVDRLENVINEKLKDQWTKSTLKAQSPSATKDKIASQFAPTFQLATFRHFVDKLIKLVLEGLQPVISYPWSHLLNEGEAVEALFAQFEANLQDPSWSPQKLQATPQKNSWQEFLVGRGYKVGLDSDMAKLPSDWATQVLLDTVNISSQPIEFAGKDWNEVADLDGWATDGPVGKPHSSD